MAAGSSAEARASALADLEKDFVAASSARPRCSLLNTALAFHRQWFGADVPLLPLTPPKLFALGAMLKAGGYRSAGNYFSRIKEEHTSAGHLWTDQLSWAQRRAIVSVTRGMGPARQSAPLQLDIVAELGLGHAPVIPGGPVGPGRLIIAGSFFCTREIELSLALRENVFVNKSTRQASWALPCSKNDQEALGKARSWGCVCGGVANKPCGYHALADQVDYLVEVFGSIEAHPALPLFPAADGKVVEKKDVVATIEQVAVRLGMVIENPDGSRMFGGHSLRVSGAQWLAGIGIPVSTIQLLARWSSDVVFRYIAEVPLSRLTEEYRWAALGERTPRVGPARDFLVESEIAKLQAQLDEHIAETGRLAAQAAAARAAAAGAKSPPFVSRGKPGDKVHLIASEYLDVVPQWDWRSKCGWAFGASRYELHARAPVGGQLCRSCAARADSMGSDSDSGPPTAREDHMA